MSISAQRVSRDASLAPHTVAHVDEHLDAYAAPRHRQPSQSSPVQTTRPHPQAWREAKRLAGGDASRLLVVSATEIVVANTKVR